MLEPAGRSTAPAAAVAAQLALEKAGPDAVLLIMASDHYIDNPSAFLDAVDAGYQAAKNGMFVTFGVKPSKPETGFGYVKTGAGAGFDHVLKVDRFVEKPDKETAKRFCAEPGYFWNAGIFLFGAQAYLDELSRFEPNMVRACLDAAVKNATTDFDFIRLADSFRRLPRRFHRLCRDGEDG